MTTPNRILLLLIFAASSTAILNAQSPQEVVVRAATEPAPATKTAPPIAPMPDATAAALQLLQEMKAANEETLKKQQGTLDQLDELQKAAQQMKIFANRG